MSLDHSPGGGRSIFLGKGGASEPSPGIKAPRKLAEQATFIVGIMRLSEWGDLRQHSSTDRRTFPC